MRVGRPVAVVAVAVALAVTATASSASTDPGVQAAATTHYDAGNVGVNSAHDGFARGTALGTRLSTRWSVVFPGFRSVLDPVVADGLVLTVVDGENPDSVGLYALDVRTGKRRWGTWLMRSNPGHAGRFRIAADRDRLFVVDSEGMVRAYTTRTGRRLWTRDFRRPGYGSLEPPTATGGRVYFYDTKQSAAKPRPERITVLDGATGRTVWQRPLKGHTGSTISVAGKSVYVSGACLDTYRLNRATGKVVWHYAKPGCSGGGGNVPVLHPSGVWVPELEEITVFSGATGRIVRRIPDAGGLAIAGTTAVTMFKGTLRGISTSTGATRWQVAVDRNNWTTGPVISGHIAYFGGQDGYVAGFDIRNGTQVWTRRGGPGADIEYGYGNLQIGGGVLLAVAGDRLTAFG